MNQFIQQIFRQNKEYEGILFVDRDGTLIEDVNYLRSVDQIKILPTVVEGIKLLNKKSIAVIVITNQPVVARGYIDETDMHEINKTLENKFKNQYAYIDAIYSCPHHPNADVFKYRINCDCRKPNIAMFKQALKDYGIKKIFGIIGDSTRDILAGKKLHLPTVIVKTGYKGKDKSYEETADHYVDNFNDGVNLLLNL